MEMSLNICQKCPLFMPMWYSSKFEPFICDSSVKILTLLDCTYDSQTPVVKDHRNLKVYTFTVQTPLQFIFLQIHLNYQP